MIVYAIIDLRSSRGHPLADAIETFVRHEDAERFVLGFGRVVNVRDEELRSR